jgi:ABC-2 type transport system ATP-binding protein
LQADPTRLVARTDDTERAALALAELVRAGIEVSDFSLGQPSLDEVFLALTGHPSTSSEAQREESETEVGA